MRKTIAICTLVLLVFALGVLLAQTKTPPSKPLVFPAKNGNVTFNHAAHVKAEKGDCKACHDKLFKQDATAPLNFKAAMHKTAVEGKTSCAGCHVAGGGAFEVKGNCAKCHKRA